MKNTSEFTPIDGLEKGVSKVVSSTPSQLEIWIQCHLGGKEASMAYNESYSIKLYGSLKVDCFEEAFKIIVSRHEGMRSVFSRDGSQIIIRKSIESGFKYHDISGFSDEEKTSFVMSHSFGTGFYEFDLEKGPLFIFELIKISELEHRLTMTAHHIVFDGWSMVLFYSSLGSVYGQLSEGKEVFLPEIHPLSDFTLKVQNFSKSEEYQVNKKYWLKKLSNPVPRLDLPIDFKRPPIRELRSERLAFKASTGLILKAKRFGVKRKISLHLLLQSIYELFLSQWCKKNEVVLGILRAGQPVMGSTNMIGHSTFLLPIRSTINLEQTFEDYLAGRKVAFAEDIDHGIISFIELIQILKIERDPSRMPLLPMTFNVSVGQERRIKFKGLEKEAEPNPKSFGNFEILLDLFGAIDKASFEWTYNKSLFKRETILAAASKYDELIGLLIENPSLELSAIKSLFEGVKDSDMELESAAIDHEEEVEDQNAIFSVVQRFQETASLFPDKTAIATLEDHLTYHELNKKSNQLAVFLKDKGIRPGDFVGVYLERSNATIVTIMAILKAGGAYLPIDVEMPENRVIYMLKNSGAKYFITDQPSFENNVLSDKSLTFHQTMEACTNLSSENHTVKTSLKSPMYIIYTSGSTGYPKGVVLTHENLDYFSNEAIKDLEFTSYDNVAGVTSVSFDVATLEILIPYLFGATVYMLDKYQRKDPKQILRFLEDKGITKMFATPTHWQMMLNSGWSKPLPSLTIFSAGEPLKKSLVDQIAPLSKEVFNLYGPSETTVFSSLKKVDRTESDITIGKAVPGTKIYLVDQSGNLIDKPNVSGELWIGGRSVGKAYLGLKELSAQKFIKNPFEEFPKRVYKSGDLGSRLPNGEIHFEGRVDDQVKIRGHRIELGEIEQRILQFDEVSNVVVDTENYQGALSLISFISFKKPLAKSFDSQKFVKVIIKQLLTQLPEYMVPREFYFVDEFKLTTSGKIDKKELHSAKKEGLKNISEESISKEEIDEFTEIEKRVYRVWKLVLENKQLDRDSDFFISGGHSLLGVKLISLLEKEFDMTLTLITLFQYPTIRSFAASIASMTKGSTSSSLVLIKMGSPDKVLCFVHGVGLNPIEVKMIVENMDKDQTIYGLQSPAISGDSKPLETIPEIAHHYLVELEKSDIQGPYNLMGNSIGGLIVFEMAKQLIESNRSLGFIGMVDSVAQFYINKPDNISTTLGRSVRKIGFEFNFIFDDIPYYLQHRVNYFQEKWRNYRGETGQENNLSSRIREIELVNRKAWRRYELESLDIDITLFLAQKRTFYVDDFETLGWSRYCRNVEKIIMPGEHAKMLKPPHGSEFIRVLQDKLNHFYIPET